MLRLLKRGHTTTDLARRFRVDQSVARKHRLRFESAGLLKYRARCTGGARKVMSA